MHYAQLGMPFEHTAHNQRSTREYVADGEGDRGLRRPQPREIVLKHLVRRGACPGVDREWDIQILQRIPQRLIELVIQAMLANWAGVDVHGFEAELFNTTTRLPDGLLGVA